MQPPNEPTLTPPADAWQPVAELAPADRAPVLLPTTGDVGGLDGRWYAPTSGAAASDPEGSASSLGHDTEFSRAVGGWGQVAAHQLPIPGLEDRERYPLLSAWERAAVAAELAGRPGQGTPAQLADGGVQDRLRKCCRGVRRTGRDDAKAHRTDRGRWVWSGLVTCGEKCCPRCGPRWAEASASKLDALFSTWLHGDAGLTNPDVWMLTLTIPHSATDDVGLLVEDLATMRQEFLRTPAWQAFASRWGIARRGGTVWALDVAFGGPSGAHPHWHVALLPSGAWVTGDERRRAALRAELPRLADDADEEARWQHARRCARIEADRDRAADPSATWADCALSALDREERAAVLALVERDARLWEAWRDVVAPYLLPTPILFGRRKGQPEPRRITRSALRLTAGEDAARYFSGWGLSSEIGGAPVKARSHLRLLDAAGAGELRAALAWKAWREATKGKQWLVGMGAALSRLGLTDEAIAERAKQRTAERDEREPPRLVEPVTVNLAAPLYPAVMWVGHAEVERVAAEAADAGADPQAAVDELLWRYLAIARDRGPPD